MTLALQQPIEIAHRRFGYFFLADAFWARATRGTNRRIDVAETQGS
jgi:hypothetical protein